MSFSKDNSEAVAAAAATRIQPEPVLPRGDRSMAALVRECPNWPVWNGSSLEINDFVSRIMLHIQPILGKYNNKLIARVVVEQCLDTEVRKYINGFPSVSTLCRDLRELSKDPDRILWSIEMFVCGWEPVTHLDPVAIKKFKCQVMKLERYCKDMGYQRLLYTEVVLGLILGLMEAEMLEEFHVFSKAKVQEAPRLVFDFVNDV
jgi:hypothetical protein